MLDGHSLGIGLLAGLGGRIDARLREPTFNVVDFTFEAYDRLLDAASAAGYEFLTVAEYLDADAHPDRFVVLRHDVDRRAGNARAMARLEREHGVTATYYVRSHLLDPELLDDLAVGGHEVGYHYEDLTAVGGDREAAVERFARNLARFREHVDVRTVCAHGNPLTSVHNLDLLRENGALDEHDLVGEARLSVDSGTDGDTDLRYFSDTDRRWGSDVPGFGEVRTTADLAAALRGGHCERAYVLAHPCRWARTRAGLASSVAWDLGARTAKAVAGTLHGGKCAGAE
jgi:hypothetical protein